MAESRSKSKTPLVSAATDVRAIHIGSEPKSNLPLETEGAIDTANNTDRPATGGDEKVFQKPEPGSKIDPMRAIIAQVEDNQKADAERQAIADAITQPPTVTVLHGSSKEGGTGFEPKKYTGTRTSTKI